MAGDGFLPRWLWGVAVCLVAVCLVAVAGVPVIVVPPANVTVMVRGTATLTCVVADKGRYEVNWVKRDVGVISTDYEVASSAVEPTRFSIVGEEARGNYSLRIRGVFRLDAGWFRCQLRDPSTVSSPVVSAPARLVVRYAPGQSYPRCLPDYRSVTGLALGQRVDFGCSTEPGEPPARLEWSQDGVAVPAELDDSETGIIQLRFSRNVTAEDNGRALICTLTHPLLPGPTTCQVGPLDVVFPPTNVTISTTTPRPRLGELQLMTCHAEANPRTGLIYTWHTFPAGEGQRESQARRLTASRGVLLLRDVEAADDGTVFVCEARSQLGSANATFALAVMVPSTTPVPAATTRSSPGKTGAPAPPNTETNSPVDGPLTAPYVIVLILIAVSLLLLALALVIFALRRKKRPSTAVISVRDLDNLHADVHSLASFGNFSRQGTPYLDRVDYEVGRSRSHSRDTFDNVSLDSASALVAAAGRSHSRSSPTAGRKYSVDSLGKPLARSSPHSYRNGSPTHGAAGGKRLDSYPTKERKLSESALSQAGRPLPKINGPVQQNEYAELTPVLDRKKYANDSVASPESGFGEDDSLGKALNDSFPPPSCNNCNYGGRKVSHVEV